MALDSQQDVWLELCNSALANAIRFRFTAVQSSELGTTWDGRMTEKETRLNVKNNGLALCCLMVMAGVVYAQTAAASNVCVIQADTALGNTKEGHAALAELEKTQTPKKTDLQKQQANIQAMQDKLQKGANTLSQSAKDEQSRAIDSATKKFNRDAEDYNAEAQNTWRKAMEGITGRLKQAINLYAKDHGCGVVINVEDQNVPVIYFCGSCDITNGVVDLYDKTQSAAKPAPTQPVTAAPPSATKPPGAAPAAVPPSAPTPSPGKKQP
jgi:outer membrane protein